MTFDRLLRYPEPDVPTLNKPTVVLWPVRDLVPGLGDMATVRLVVLEGHSNLGLRCISRPHTTSATALHQRRCEAVTQRHGCNHQHTSWSEYSVHTIIAVSTRSSFHRLPDTRFTFLEIKSGIHANAGTRPFSLAHIHATTDWSFHPPQINIG